MQNEWAKKCLSFIDQSVSCYHAVETIEKMLIEKGYLELCEKDDWKIRPGEKYFVKRNDSSIIAFALPKGEIKGFHIVASHSDSPSFKVKTKPEMKAGDIYVKLNVEPYGGMIYATWFDRCLSVAGRIVCDEAGELKSRTVNIDEDLLVIPNVAIHMNREMNKELSYNPQTDLLPLISVDVAEEDEKVEKKEKKVKDAVLLQKLAVWAGVQTETILGSDLFLYVRERGKLAGAGKELMIAPRLDDLECVYASAQALLDACPKEYVSVCAVFDNEEVGSLTRQGAASTFLKDTLERLSEALGKKGSEYLRLLADSFLISADNAHALHPNHGEKADPVNKPMLNGGIVIKHHGGQKYTTDGYTEAVMKSLCREAEVPYQDYHNRSDIPGGSTLGNISGGQVSVPAVDIGLAQLAMHSAVETAGSKDIEYLIKALKVFYQK